MNDFGSRSRKKYVLSFRVSEAEWQLLQTTSREAGADVSSLLRQSLKLWLQQRQS